MLRSVERVEFRPLNGWPGEMTRHRQRSRFRSSWTAMCELLDRELFKLGCRQLVIEIALGADQIRIDGMPRAAARPEHPGVILSFESRHGPLRYPCDTFDFWQDNVYAIALAIEALRAVDRYGVTRRNEQYAGWAALPPPSNDAEANGFGSHRDAAAFMAGCADPDFGLAGGLSGAESQNIVIDGILHDAEVRREFYRLAAIATHPDRNGGDERKLKKLQAARRMLDASSDGRANNGDPDER